MNVSPARRLKKTTLIGLRPLLHSAPRSQKRAHRHSNLYPIQKECP